MYQLQIKEQTITLEGNIFTPDIFKSNASLKFFSDSFRSELFLFLQDWFSPSPTLKVLTSGSTGDPKEIFIEKERMMQSACLTCSFLDLQKGDKTLLCLPLNYIAGKMVVVRALIAGLDLHPVSPTGNPLTDKDIPFDFAAMIPLQVFNSLQSDVEKERLANIKKLIIGGGAIDPLLEEALKPFPNAIYSTYGMTETLSHIALRKINGVDASANYIPFPSVSVSLSVDDSLIIDAPLVSKERLYTNDVAEIYEDGSFRIVGRKDNIINSGGVKIQIEEVERLLRPYISCNYAVTSMPDPKFGEIIVLVIEREIDSSDFLNFLPTYYRPKKVIKIDAIPLTETGKINRPVLKSYICNSIGI